MNKVELKPRRTFEESSHSITGHHEYVKTGEQLAAEVVLPRSVEMVAENIRSVLAYMASEYRLFCENERKHNAGFEYEYGQFAFNVEFKQKRALLDKLGLGRYLDEIEHAVDNNMTPNPFEDMDRVGL